MAFEGLNHAGVTDANLLIILNDNTMGIDPSVGALKNYFTNVKAGKKVRKNNIIEALNLIILDQLMVIILIKSSQN